MRTDDDVFVNTDNLFNFLLNINSDGTHFLGQAGRGRGEEEGHLSLQWNENFCMGGTGMLMSGSTLQMFMPKIDTCLTNMVTNHEDVEIGKLCIIKNPLRKSLFLPSEEVSFFLQKKETFSG